MPASGKKILKKVPLFKNLNASQIDQIMQIVKFVKYPENSVVIKEEERGDELFILLDGEVEVSKSLILEVSKFDFEMRKKALTRLTAETHPIFGEMSLFDEEAKRTATVITTKPSRFAVIKKNDFFNLVEKNKELGYILLKNIARVLTERLKRANTDILKLTTALSLVLRK
jgi:CRP-like cAMP-binding protein